MDWYWYAGRLDRGRPFGSTRLHLHLYLYLYLYLGELELLALPYSEPSPALTL